MPRTPKTAEQASRDNAAKFNRLHLEQMPLRRGAGMATEPQAAGVIRTRKEDHQLRLCAQGRGRMAELEARHAREVEAYRRALKEAVPEAYREALLKLRHLQRRYASMHRPTDTCDHWHTHLRKAVPVAQWRAVEGQANPASAQQHRALGRIEAHLRRSLDWEGVQT